jgi:hypothetical protein
MSVGRATWTAAAIAILCTVYAAGALTIYPSLFPDPAYGLLVEQGRAAGAPWNHYLEPAPEDISQDRAYFNAAWSPGQQLLPSLLTRAGFSLGSALRSVSVIASLAGLAGWFLLYRAMGVDHMVALVGTLLLASARSYSFPFLAYIGGDMLAFSAFPFLAFLVLRLRTSAWIVVAAPCAVLAGFFFKHSLAIYIAGWAAAVVAMSITEARRPAGTRWAIAGSTGVLVAGAAWLIQWGYASRGWSATVYQPTWSTDPATYAIPWAMPILAGTGIDHLLSRVFDNPQFVRLDYRHSFWVIVPAVAAMLMVLFAASRDRGLRVISQTTALFVAGVVSVFALLMGSGSANELYASRHYVIAGAVLLPLLVHLLMRRWSAGIRVAGLCLLAVPAIYGVLSFGVNWQRHYDRRASHSSSAEIVHLNASPRVVGYLQKLNATLGRATLVVVPEPSLAVEFTNTRVLAMSATSAQASDFDRYIWHGRAQSLVVVTEDGGQTPEEIQAWLNSFVAYDRDGWSRFTVDGYSFYVPRGQAIDRAWLESSVDGVS